IAFQHVFERFVAEPGDYRFEAQVRTEGLTTDRGFGFRIAQLLPGGRSATTPVLTGSNGWSTLAATLRIGPGPRAIEIQMLRIPSWKFDNRIRGVVWVDDVRLRRIDNSDD